MKNRGKAPKGAPDASNNTIATKGDSNLPTQTSGSVTKVLPTVDMSNTPQLRPVGSTTVTELDSTTGENASGSTSLGGKHAHQEGNSLYGESEEKTSNLLKLNNNVDSSSAKKIHASDSHGHGHSHGLPVSRSGSVSSKYGSDLESILVSQNVSQVHGLDAHSDVGCMHHKATLTECGHEECLSPEELRALGARRTLIWASAFCFFFMCCEIVGGYLSNSLAIITDAAHLLSDLASFLISIMSLIIARKTPTNSLSFGFHRAEILGAIVSVLIIWLMTGGLLYEAYVRMITPQEVNGKLMFIVATLGLIVNLGMGAILLHSGHAHSHGGLPGGMHNHSHGEDEHDDDHDHEDDHEHGHGHSHGKNETAGCPSDEEATATTSLLAVGHGHSHGGDYGSHDSSALSAHGHAHEGSKLPKDHDIAHLDLWDRIFHNPRHNINIRAALVHALGDAVQSFGVMLAAALIWWKPEYTIADPICTVVFSVIVLFTTIRILREAVLVLMEATPDAIDTPTVASQLLNLPGVIRIHDLHIWSLSVGLAALSVHITIDPTRVNNADALQAAQEMLRRKYNIAHTTIQIETLTDDITCNNSNKVRQCVKA